MNRLRHFLQHLFARPQRDQDLDAEIRAYEDGLADEKRNAGFSDAEARRQAALETGGREQVKEAVRDIRFGVWMDHLARDVVQSARLLARSRGFAAMAVLTLALGMGPNIAIFSFVNGILLRPLPYPDSASLVQLFQTRSGPFSGDTEPVSPGAFGDWSDQAQTVEKLSAFGTRMHVLTGAEPERVTAARVTSGFFETLGVMPMLGQAFASSEQDRLEENRVILSHGVWQRHLGGRNEVVGQSMQISGSPFTVVGVMPPGFAYPEGAGIWVPLVFRAGEAEQRASSYLEVIARLKPGVQLAAAQAEFSAIAARIGERYPSVKGNGVRIASMHGEKVKGVRTTLALLFAAVALVLLVACANAANLILARGLDRSRELAVRAALGAGRGRLMQQLLSESLLIALLSGTLGLLIAAWSLDALRAVSPASVPRLSEVRIDAGVVGFALLLVALTPVLFGVLPAWRATRLNLSEALKDGRSTDLIGGRSPAGSTLVVMEVALSMVLLVGAGLMLRTLWGLVSVNPGFDPRNVLTAEVSLPRHKYGAEEQQIRFATLVLEGLRALPGVQAASITSHLPLAGGQMSNTFLLEGQTPASLKEAYPGAKGNPQVADLRFVSPDYFGVMRMPLARGRGFTEREALEAAPVALVNQTMAAKYWPGQDAIGKRLRVSFARDGWLEIAGIVEDIRHASLRAAPAAEIYLPSMQGAMGSFRLAVRTSVPPTLLASALRQAVWAADKDQPVTRVRAMEGVLFAAVAEPRFFGVLFSIFAAVALLLAGCGTYSLMSYMVTRRTREIGIRMALGARPDMVKMQFLREGLWLVALGMVPGCIAALYASRWLEKLLFGVSRSDPATYASVVAVLLCATLAACMVPAWRATRVDPMIALRQE